MAVIQLGSPFDLGVARMNKKSTKLPSEFFLAAM
jgi:hypothetical protein